MHPNAIVDKKANLADDVRIGAYALVEAGVSLAKGVKVLPFAHLKGNTSVGENTIIGTGAVIGEVPQVLDVTQSEGQVYIGKNNIIREYVTINCSTSKDKSTSIGDDNFLMAFSHLAHDCKVGNGVVICNGVLVAGHTQIDDKAFISGNVVIHQFARIGRLAMVGGLSRVNQDVLPFMMVVGDSRVWGVNIVGLKRAGLNREDLGQIKKAYNLIYRKKLSLKGALAELEKIDSKFVKEIIVFILASNRGICGPKRSSLVEKLFLDYPYLIRKNIPTQETLIKQSKNFIQKQSDLGIKE